jgi:hypothetical protein
VDFVFKQNLRLSALRTVTRICAPIFSSFVRIVGT